MDDKRRNETRLLSTPVRNGETLQQLIINHGRYSAHFALREKNHLICIKSSGKSEDICGEREAEGECLARVVGMGKN